MIIQYALSYKNLELLGIYNTIEQAKRDATNIPNAVVREIQVIPHTIIHHATFGWNMFEVHFSDQAQGWVLAGNCFSAVVEIAVALGVTKIDTQSTWIKEHKSYTKGQGKRGKSPATTYTLSPLMADILTYLTPYNKDLIAHLLEGVEEYATLEEVATDCPVGDLTAQSIRQETELIWHQTRNWMFLEETGATLNIHNFIDTHRNISDTDETLFWTFVLCMWGGQACFSPYALYQCITQHRFDRFWAAYQDIRPMFGGT